MDGALGHVRDLYFDDREWTVRYFVVDTRAWLPGRHVLVSPVAISRVDWAEQAIRVTLTKDQVKDGPDIASDRPVSRQEEAKLAEYYAWPMYWGLPDPAAVPPTLPPKDAGKAPSGEAVHDDPHLRSLGEVTGYHIAAKDGEIGHVADLLGNDTRWAIRYLVIDTRNWLPGKRTLVSPAWIEAVDWAKAKVGVALTRGQIRQAPEYDPNAPISREYETQLYDFYEQPVYWRDTPAGDA